MGRGDNPNSRANLRPFKAGLPEKTQREIQRKGSKAGNEAKAQQKKLNEDLKERCTPERMGKLNDKLLAMAEKGNLKAYELVRDGLGEKPIDKMAIGVSDKSLERLQEDFKEDM